MKINKKGQGMTEYIVLLAIVVGIIILVVKTNLTNSLSTGLTNIGNKITTQTQ